MENKHMIGIGLFVGLLLLIAVVLLGIGLS